MSFVIEPGQTVAFVGATGAGKSSILNLIGRYYDIQKVRSPLTALTSGSWTSMLSAVQWDRYSRMSSYSPVIFKAISACGNPPSPMVQIRSAAKFVNADGFIASWSRAMKLR